MTAQRWFSRRSINGIVKWRYMEYDNGSEREVPPNVYYNSLVQQQEKKQPDAILKIREQALQTFRSSASGRDREIELNNHLNKAVDQLKASWIRSGRSVDLGDDAWLDGEEFD